MKRRYAFLSAFLLAALSMSGAEAGWLGHHGSTYDRPDWDHKLDLGVDIRRVGSSPAEVQAFVNSLPPQTQSEVWGGCQTFLTWPGNVQAETLMFCRMLYR